MMYQTQTKKEEEEMMTMMMIMMIMMIKLVTVYPEVDIGSQYGPSYCSKPPCHNGMKF